MAIYFELIPEKKRLPKFPRWWTWPLLLIFFLIIGTAITAYMSIDSSISNGWFLAGVLLIPLSVWILVSSFWLYSLFYREHYTVGWNRQHEARYAELTEEGQRPLYILFSALYTEQGYNVTAQKIILDGISLQTKIPRQGTKAIPHAQLALEDEILATTLDLRAKYLFQRLYKQISHILISPWVNYPIHVRFCLDAELDKNQIRQLWQIQFSSYDFISFEFIEPAQNGRLIDKWIDNDNEALLLIVSMRLFDSPQEKEGEAFSALLFASDSLLSYKAIKQAIVTQSIELVTLHRPEISTDLEKVIHHSVLWGAKEEAELTTIWYSHIDLERVPIITTQLNEQGVKLKHTYHLDNTIGHAGDCAYFSAIALACEHAQSTKDKQLVVCQNGEMSASVVIRSQLSS